MTESQIAEEVARLVAAYESTAEESGHFISGSLPRTVPAVRGGHLAARIVIQYLPRHAGHRDARRAMVGADHDLRRCILRNHRDQPVTMH